MVQVIPLPPEDLVIFELPHDLMRPLRKLRHNLSRLGGLEFATLVQQSQIRKFPYEFEAHRKSQDLALAEACREIGWTARGQLYGKVLSFYWIQKDLVFWRFLTSVRESLLQSLNDGLARIGSKIGFDARLAISGLPTQDEIAAGIEALHSGRCAFTDIMDAFKY